jgi:glycosyltransferase involved in cell wall biosynthesis
VKISFLIPVYNEAATVAELISRVLALPLEKELIVVDDGSTDGSGAILATLAARHPEIRLVRQHNGGKGSALRAGIPLVSGEIAVIQDADLEYDPAEVPGLVEPIESGHADVVFGSRLSGGRPQRAYLFWHRVGNRLLSLITGILYNTTLTDMETGYKAFRADILKSLDLREDGFSIEPEITAKVCKRHLRIYELPISYYGRSYAEGKKITWRDGFSALRVLLHIRIVPSKATSSHIPTRVAVQPGAPTPVAVLPRRASSMDRSRRAAQG